MLVDGILQVGQVWEVGDYVWDPLRFVFFGVVF